jgi:hypothetical protein
MFTWRRDEEALRLDEVQTRPIQLQEPEAKSRAMPILKVTITNSKGQVADTYELECVDRPRIDVEAFDTRYTINLIRTHSERHRFISDFEVPPTLSLKRLNFDLSDLGTAYRLQNINELWFEIEGLFLRARLGFATARMLKLVEDQHTGKTEEDRGARLNFHLDKMEQFDLAAFELVRIEDLVARTIYEYFGDSFLEKVTEANKNWEKGSRGIGLRTRSTTAVGLIRTRTRSLTRWPSRGTRSSCWLFAITAPRMFYRSSRIGIDVHTGPLPEWTTPAWEVASRCRR